jgi:membrane fusion protein (multidrug efflux system)
MIPSCVRIPQRAVQLNDKQANVSIVNPDGTVSIREVQLGELGKGGWVIDSGLKPGEKVIVDGWQKVQPGQKVRVRPADETAQPNSGKG